MEKISVIVPVYNSENVLRRSVDSILSQTYPNIEIILINDGSTDSSLEILREYERNYNSVKVLNQDNQGQSKARNEGLRIATGQYIGFVDSDDYIHPEMYEKLYDIMIESNSDISVIDVKAVNNILEVNLDGNIDTTSIIKGTDTIVKDYLFRGLKYPVGNFASWRKLYRRNVIKNIRYPEGLIHEDTLFNFEVLFNCDRLVYSSKVMYFYFQDSVSTTRSSFSKRDLDLILISKQILKESLSYGNSEIIKLSEMKLGDSYFALLAKLAYSGENLELEEKNKIMELLLKGLNEYYSRLMKAPFSAKKKLLITLFRINYSFFSKLLISFNK